MLHKRDVRSLICIPLGMYLADKRRFGSVRLECGLRVVVAGLVMMFYYKRWLVRSYRRRVLAVPETAGRARIRTEFCLWANVRVCCTHS